MSKWYSSTSPRGVRVLAEFEILVGIAYILLGTFLLYFLAISGVGAITLGLILIYMGWALDKLEIWAWQGSLLMNGAICFGNIIFGGDYLSFILSLAIIIYLLTPGVRSRFFQ
ncbi:MAG: hypothetical protein ACFFER_04735 [Candidatus Thorarchaeota archaeon]